MGPITPNPGSPLDKALSEVFTAIGRASAQAVDESYERGRSDALREADGSVVDAYFTEVHSLPAPDEDVYFGA